MGHEELNTHWVGAGHLVIGDKLKLADGRTGSVVNVTTQAKTQEMFNLTVDTAHTFYVGINGWLAHNASQPLIVCPDLTHPKYGTMPKNWDNHTAQHIFEGEIEVLDNGTRNAVGWHYEASGDPSKVRIDGKPKNPDTNGVYRAKISIFDEETGQWIQKASETTFFPRNWTPEKVMSEIEYALKNAYSKSAPAPHPSLLGADSYIWEGRSREGVLIKGFYDITNDRLISAFAVRGK